MHVEECQLKGCKSWICNICGQELQPLLRAARVKIIVSVISNVKKWCAIYILVYK